MISVQGLAVSVAVLYLFSGIFGNVLQNGVAYAMCNWCSEGRNAFFVSFSNVIGAGQNSMKEGIEGLIRLRDDTKYVDALAKIDATLPQKQATLFYEELKRGLIIFGLFTIGVALSWNIVFKVFHPHAPFFFIFFLTFLTVGLTGYVFTHSVPYFTVAKILANTDLWIGGVINAVSPVPFNASNITDSGNLTGALGK